jgi:hypothetical protein
VSASAFIYLAPFELGLRDAVLRLGAEPDRVISWERTIPLRLGQGRTEGEYVKVFMPYGHGLVPIATIGFIESGGCLAVDSALFTERLDFVARRLPHWYEGPFFKPLVSAVGQSRLSHRRVDEQLLWASHLRSLAALYMDGARAASKGAGHVMRRMMRQLAEVVADDVPGTDEVGQLAAAADECLGALGYSTFQPQPFAAFLDDHVRAAGRQITRERQRFVEALGTTLSAEDVKRWHEERGLSIEWIAAEAKMRSVPAELPTASERFWLRNACYPFPGAGEIYDPIAFLKEAEERRMKGVKS